MVHIGNLCLGFFYTKDKNTLVEIDGLETVVFPFEYAKTVSGCVVALLDEDGDVIDIDDIPREEMASTCGEEFVSFVRGKGVTAFLIPPYLLSNEDVVKGACGELSAISVYTDSLILQVLTIANMVSASDVCGNGDYLLLVAKDGSITENKNTKTATIASAHARFLSISFEQ